MALENVSLRINNIASQGDQRALLPLVNALVDALNAVTAKLDADAGVTDTNYTATVAAIVKK